MVVGGDSHVVIWIIPLVGQLAYVGLAFAGAFFLYQANFDWQSVAYPETKTISIAAMTSEQFDEYKKNITPQLERDCKRGALAQNSVDGKLPIQISKRCECLARTLPAFSHRLILCTWKAMMAKHRKQPRIGFAQQWSSVAFGASSKVLVILLRSLLGKLFDQLALGFLCGTQDVELIGCDVPLNAFGD